MRNKVYRRIRVEVQSEFKSEDCAQIVGAMVQTKRKIICEAKGNNESIAVEYNRSSLRFDRDGSTCLKYYGTESRVLRETPKCV
jgi:hypothetical protein